ncbi:PREDICTED: uncharacterized protein LOC106111731 [Papilio polytes]|uniref:uncharacterized protein LOC106111731 n=1 Tax=Papilio polytes TaxID=76194 RepID=UPI0006768175|nr:PREDICTED: uncharacterized protein LOC106111731 [Papilio polytes]
MKFVELTFFITFYSEVISQQIEFYPSQSLTYNKVKNVRVQKSTRKVNFKETGGEYHIFSDWKPYKSDNKTNKDPVKRAVDPVFYGNPKTKEELWHEHFLQELNSDERPSLISLLHNITLTYLNDCTPVILYDRKVKTEETHIFQNFLKNFPISFTHGYIEDNDKLREPNLLKIRKDCLHYVVFLSDVKRIAKVLGKQSQSKVIVVARSSQWTVHEFLASSLSRMIINLLVIGQSFRGDSKTFQESPYILYTHELYTDGLGASKPVVLNSWSNNKFSRQVNLFPSKVTEGYAGHRFTVAASDKPPFIFKRIIMDPKDGNIKVTWDGIEMRLLNLLAKRNNFSIEIVEPRDLSLGPETAVLKEVMMDKADIATAGLYVTSERLLNLDLSFPHSQDCAVFITLMSTALPRYRAILGPFHWHVWLALTFTYLIAIFPLAFSDKHTLRHLINNSGEVENMFWYVFGTFTNCFTFVGKNSWSKTTKITTRLLIGWYWLFTIIITSCYTGCIIAFVTLPIFPDTIDTIKQLLAGFYRVGTLDRGGWEKWFLNSSDPDTNRLFKKIEYVPDVRTGIRNVTRAFFWPYAFLGSQAELEHIVLANFTNMSSKRAKLHISNECFAPFGVALGFPRNSVYNDKFSGDVRRLLQSGIINKIVDEVRWEIQRSSSDRLWVGKVSQKVNSVQEKGLTLEDTQGMFLLLGAGFLIAGGALLSEWMGGCSRKCTVKRAKASSVSSENLVPNNVYAIREKGFNISDSTDSLDGQVINVSEESITIHNEFNVFEFSSKSSSTDIDNEVHEIFEIDEQRKHVLDKEESFEIKTANTKSPLGEHINN